MSVTVRSSKSRRGAHLFDVLGGRLANAYARAMEPVYRQMQMESALAIDWYGKRISGQITFALVAADHEAALQVITVHMTHTQTEISKATLSTEELNAIKLTACGRRQMQ